MKTYTLFLLLLFTAFGVYSQQIPEGKGRVKFKVYNGIGEPIKAYIEIYDDDAEGDLISGDSDMLFDLNSSWVYIVDFCNTSTNERLCFSQDGITITEGQEDVVELDNVSRAYVTAKNYLGKNVPAKISFGIDPSVFQQDVESFPFIRDVEAKTHQIVCEFVDAKGNSQELLIKQKKFNKGKETLVEFASKYGGLNVDPKNERGETSKDAKIMVYKGSAIKGELKALEILKLLPGEYNLEVVYEDDFIVKRKVKVYKNNLTPVVIEIKKGVLHVNARDAEGSLNSRLKSCTVYNEKGEPQGENLITGESIELRPGNYYLEYLDVTFADKLATKKFTIESGKSKIVWIGAENHGVLEIFYGKVNDINSSSAVLRVYDSINKKWHYVETSALKIGSNGYEHSTVLPIGYHALRFFNLYGLDTIIKPVQIKKGVTNQLYLKPSSGTLKLSAFNGLEEETSGEVSIFERSFEIGQLQAGKEYKFPVGEFSARIKAWEQYTEDIPFKVEKGKTTVINFVQPSAVFKVNILDYIENPLSNEVRKTFSQEYENFYVVDGKRYNFEVNKEVLVLPGKHTMYLNISGIEMDTVLNFVPEKLNEFNIKFGAIRAVVKDGQDFPENLEVRGIKKYYRISFNDGLINLPKGDYTLDFDIDDYRPDSRGETRKDNRPNKFIKKYNGNPLKISVEWGMVSTIDIESINDDSGQIDVKQKNYEKNDSFSVPFSFKSFNEENEKYADYQESDGIDDLETGNYQVKWDYLGEPLVIGPIEVKKQEVTLVDLSKYTGDVTFNLVNKKGFKVNGNGFDVTVYSLNKEIAMRRGYETALKTLKSGTYDFKFSYANKEVWKTNVKIPSGKNTLVEAGIEQKGTVIFETNIPINSADRIEVDILKEEKYLESFKINEYVEMKSSEYKANLLYKNKTYSEKLIVSAGDTVAITFSLMKNFDKSFVAFEALNGIGEKAWAIMELSHKEDGTTRIFPDKREDVDFGKYEITLDFRSKYILDYRLNDVKLGKLTDTIISTKHYGRIQFKAYNKQKKEIDYFVRIEKNGEYLASTSGFRGYYDLPAGTYGLKFLVAGEDVKMNDITVVAGKINPVEVDLSKEELSSDFSMGTEGWKIVGDAQGNSTEPIYTEGSITAKDDAVGGVWYWKAPEAYLGNQSRLYGRKLSYRLKTNNINDQFDHYDIVLKGAGKILTYDTELNPGINWTDYQVGIHESRGWMNKSTGQPVTQIELKEVLSDISELLIRGEFRTGGDTGWLDSVHFD